ncbi:MAG: OmpH family outer membrane protein [Halomonadaceae bacterium]|nr:MAG: OmpH family outer membrane protein [Halomonadaceae bacterium]
MRKGMLALLLALVALPASAEMKIAVVDLRQAVFSSNAATEFTELLQGQMQSEETRVRSAQEEARKLQQRLEQDGAMMNDSERQRLTSQYEQKVQEFQQLRGQFDQVVNQRQQQFLQQARPLVDAAMEAILEEYQLDLILPAEAVVYVTPDRDLTDELRRRLNQEVE